VSLNYLYLNKFSFKISIAMKSSPMFQQSNLLKQLLNLSSDEEDTNEVLGEVERGDFAVPTFKNKGDSFHYFLNCML
jgi:hypothetical protein